MFNRIISEGENAYPDIKEETDMIKKILTGVLVAALLLPVGTGGSIKASARCGHGGNGCGRYYTDEDRDGICDNYADGTCPRYGTGQSPKSKNQSLKTKVSLKKGRKYCVKVAKGTKGVTYRTSNRKVATISKKGVVRARKKGKCTVYAYSKKKVCKKVKLTVL